MKTQNKNCTLYRRAFLAFSEVLHDAGVMLPMKFISANLCMVSFILTFYYPTNNSTVDHIEKSELIETNQCNIQDWMN